MISKQKLYYIFLVVCLLVFLSCRLSDIKFPSRTVPTTQIPIPVSTQAAGDMIKEVQSAIETANNGGKVQIVITETQMTSLVALELLSIQEPKIQDIQIRLQNGQIQLNGKVLQNNITFPFNVVAEINVNNNGQPSTNILSAKLGPLPIPQSLLDEITSKIDQMIITEIFSSNNVVVESISIANGAITITGNIH
jgi:uncharacterized protein YpmS